MEVNPNLSNKALQDYVLIQKAMRGDEQSFAELLGRYKDSIYFMLLKMVNNKVDAEDLTIEAFTKAFKNLNQYSPTYAFSTWLFKIATNNCIDFLRRKRKDLVSIDAPTNDYEQDNTIVLPSDILDPEEELIKEQNINLVKNIVEKLKPRYRLLIELRYFKDYSYEEIAEELGIPIGTVKAQLFRARELLQLIMKKSEHNI
jgi:RNA polymerase sigma-70 factor (ECF subfamily)